MSIFEGKIAVVTGGGSGIGKSICLYLAHYGAKVVVADWNFESAKEIEEQIASEGGHVKAVHVDVSKREEVKDLIESTVNEYGRIDFLFNNAGVSVNGEFQDIDPEMWKRTIDVNLWGVVYGCHYAYPVMMKQGFGHIVNTASLGGLIPGGLTTSYSASKHAVVGFSLTLRSEAKQYGIKVTALCPGYLRTNIQKTTPNVSPFMNSEKNKKMNEKMKFLTPEDCIDSMMRGIEKNKSIVIAPLRHKVFWWLNRLFPGFMPFMFSKIIKAMKKED